MSKEVRIELSDEEFEHLKEVKEREGVTWRGVLRRGTREIESNQINPATKVVDKNEK